MSLTLECFLDVDGGEGGVTLQCDDTEARRIAQILRFPWTPNCMVIVTIAASGLTDEFRINTSQGRGDDPCQLPLVDFED